MNEKDENLELSESMQKQIDRSYQELNDEKQLKIKWRKELLANESFMNYLEGFYNSGNEAIDSYLRNKFRWYKYGDMYKQKAERERSEWIDAAYECLEEILQKKLFDLQCLWRANEVKLEGIDICYEFNSYERDIFNCPFLEPITESDIALYEDFLNKGDMEYHRFGSLYEWQNYEEIKKAYHSDNFESDMPEWYEFHNLRTGNTRLLLLPNTRGDLEEFYLDLNRKHQEKVNPPQVNPNPIAFDKRPFFRSFDDDVMAYIVTTFDDKESQIKHSNFFEGYSRNDGDDEYYENIFRDLMNAKEFVPINAHFNFKEALENAFKAYRCKKIAEHLPIAYEQYLFNRQMGFSVPNQERDMGVLIDKYKEAILNGRELNGEPRDFNF